MPTYCGSHLRQPPTSSPWLSDVSTSPIYGTHLKAPSLPLSTTTALTYSKQPTSLTCSIQTIIQLQYLMCSLLLQHSPTALNLQHSPNKNRPRAVYGAPMDLHRCTCSFSLQQTPASNLCRYGGREQSMALWRMNTAAPAAPAYSNRPRPVCGATADLHHYTYSTHLQQAHTSLTDYTAAPAALTYSNRPRTVHGPIAYLYHCTCSNSSLLPPTSSLCRSGRPTPLHLQHLPTATAHEQSKALQPTYTQPATAHEQSNAIQV